MIIDTFTRKLFAKPLRNKTAEIVGQAIQNIFTENDIHPKVIQTDNGTEFNDVKVDEAKHIKSNSYTPQNQGIVERTNQTIKRMIYKHIKLTGKSNWSSILQELINNYNDSYHKAIKSSPNKLWNSSQEEQDQVAVIDIPRKKQRMEESNKRKASFYIEVRIAQRTAEINRRTAPPTARTLSGLRGLRGLRNQETASYEM